VHAHAASRGLVRLRHHQRDLVRARYRLEGAYTVDWAVRAVDVMLGLSGASGLYESGESARAFRDAHAVKQHFSFNTDIAATTYGRAALGLPSDNPTL
jgi:3-hydroxy-9,10-secoandrosta-1,3,5(10)-triene-9,17-dione monooxygenase